MLRVAQLRPPATLAVLLALPACVGQDDCGPEDRVCRNAFATGTPTDAPPEYGTEIEGPGSGNQGPGPGYLDQDGDGFTPRMGDCDDLDAAVHPDAQELCDEVDNDCNGMVDDGLGTTQVQESDYGADGIPDYYSYTTYRSSGQLWFTERDTNADGAIDDSEEYFFTYDGAGRLVLTETDDQMDGTIDKTKAYFYDAAGRLERTEEDDGVDGVLDRIDTYLYDANGYRVAWEMDTDADLLVDTRYNYVYDGTGRLEELIVDRYDDNLQIISTTIYAYEYDASGMISTVFIDLSGDGTFDNTTEYVYDALGRMRQALTDLGADELIDSVTTYEYDAATGDLEKIEMDTDNDGDLDTRISRWVECSDAEFAP
ncbi:MAG: hypothetical protein D6798_05570 [Deltaproteobacteria bacterium]|nr:MAG: hypothetical protein D6798_05570 [Deltaproteobacteria bacterium]